MKGKKKTNRTNLLALHAFQLVFVNDADIHVRELTAKLLIDIIVYVRES